MSTPRGRVTVVCPVCEGSGELEGSFRGVFYPCGRCGGAKSVTAVLSGRDALVMELGRAMGDAVAAWVEAHRLMKESRDDADRTTRMYRDRLTSLTAQLREAVEVGQQIDALLSTTLSGGTNVAKLQRLRDRLAAVACTLEVPGD